MGCKFQFPPLSHNSNDDDAFEQGQALREKHLLCHALSEEKAKFDLALAAGNGVACPGCGIVGRKDGMCTHMTCAGCTTVWCYLCGLSVEDCDKAPRERGEPIFGHNEDWQADPERCPMYIGLIGQVDETWEDLAEEADIAEDEFEERCLDRFHKWRALRKLKELRNELGEENWNQLRETFPTVRNCGYTEQEIESAGDLPLFTRRSNRA